MVQLNKKLLFLRALVPSLGVKRMWTKKSDHALKNEGADFFDTCPKRAILEKNNSSLTIFLSSLGLYLLNVSKMWLANLLTTIFTKK